MRFTITSVAAFAATTAALSITSPEKHDDVDLSKSTTIEWNSVSSDPSSFDIYLVNMNGYPNVNKLVAENVKTSDNSYTLKDLAGIDNGSGFQVNFMSNDDKSTGILAQSAQFNVESSDSASTTASSSSTSTSSSSSSSASSASSTTTKGTSTAANSSSSATPSETIVPSNGAGSLKVPVAAAGSLLMGLYMVL
ncbi:GPI anchored serine-threonine rich family protein [Aspergillus glaucus CBS 516.65]|uniref:Yeast cell wall synthesis Kre9/Knh1-like N-terminal domain-containing protein n=1 Tax=Aspergillus glaucus CBS 516.65 TaxID=1160497 RepID=A0A1L9VQ66_ASPGL|nr:hypothetical protein ASPGLDRAFT_1308064 [Aspergillus glaucus CBS 516.65]OJJ86032.1 hypothetical protein ASPGLDRAFT_1308064 [Aspergillus glaucus CBS 516.65]